MSWGLEQNGDDLVERVNRAERLLKPALARELKSLGNEVKAAAQEIIDAKGLIGHGDHGDPSHHPGQMREKISVRGGASRVTVKETATTTTSGYGTYSYPRRLEYEGGSATAGLSGTSPGGSAFMTPARDQVAPRVEPQIERMLVGVFREAGL